MHLTDEQIQQLVDGQPEAALPGLEQHLGSCAECQDRLAVSGAQAAEVATSLRLVDHPVPPVSAQAVIRLARQRQPGFGRWAAAILLSVGLVGVAYAAPGSPLPGWIESMATWVGAESDRPAYPEATPSAPLPQSAGIAVLPGENLSILFQLSASGASARVSLTDGAEVVVRARSGDAGFSAGADQLVITARSDSTSFDVQIPQSAPRIEIKVGGHRVFLKLGARIATEAAPAPDGSYRLPLNH